MTTAAVVLAAGAGTRFTGPGHKLLASIGSESLIERSLAVAIAAGLDDVVLVTGAADLTAVVQRRPGVTHIRNPDWEDGIATSLQRGIDAARSAGHDAVVVGLADQPGIQAEGWRLVAAATATPMAVATYDGVRGNPVRLAAAVWDELPTRGDEGARVLLRRCPELVSEVPCPGSPDDVDTVEDLHRWT